MSAYSNPVPDPDDPSVSRLKAALLARGASGVILWFLLLTGAIIALTLIANRCGDDDDAGTAAGAGDDAGQVDDDGGDEDDVGQVDDDDAGAEEPEPEPEPTATPEPEPTATPEPEPTATPEPEPTPTAVPSSPAEIAAEVAGATAVLTGTVPDQETADALLAAAEGVLGVGNVTSELVIDPDATVDDATLSLSGSIEEQTGQALIDALAGVLPGADVSTDGLDIVASVDVVGQLNAIFAANPVQFASGSAEILPESIPVLDEVAAALLDAPALALEVQGHTDNTGSSESNLVLSLSRAQAVLDYLVEGGVGADRLTAVGFGEDQPIADNATPEGQQANRRIEFQLL